MAREKIQRYYERPTQVAFYDMENGGMIGGIAYRGEIICLKCGAVIEINDFLDEIEETYPEVILPIIPLSWCSLSDECIG